MKIWKKAVFSVVIVIFLSSISLGNGLNLNSLGSKAVSMGGAFIGLADDFSALFWNPAGLAQLDKKTFGFYGTDIIPSGAYRLTIPVINIDIVNAETESKHYLAGMGGFFYPVNEDLVAGFGVYTPSGLGASWNGADFAAVTDFLSYDWKSQVGVVTFSPAAAYKISDSFMIGASFNINYAMFDISTWAGMPEVLPGLFFNMGQQEMSLTGWGYGATFGIMVKPHKMINIGASFRTPASVKFTGDTMIENLDILGQLFALNVPDTSAAETEVVWPMWFGIGVALFPLDNLTITADFQYTDWAKIEEIDLRFTEQMWALFLPADATAIKMNWASTSQIRFGAEYKINKLALRGGLYFDPAPAPDLTMNVLLPSFDFTGITGGLGYALNGLNIDFAVEYLIGKDRDIPFLIDGEETEQPGAYSMKIFVPTISVSYGW